MRRFLKVFLAVVTVIIVTSSVILPAEAREGFDIVNHTVEMEVREDGNIIVTETMNVHFLTQLHGIYVNIPSKYDMTWQINGETRRKSYDFPVIHVKVLSDHKSDISSYSKGIQIKIGSSSKYANEYEIYKFRYEIKTRDLDLDGLQMLFMNIVSGKWNTDTQSVNFTIAMPKPFDADKLLISSPQGVTNGSQGPLNVIVSGSTISGSYSETLKAGQAITVQLTLPDGYFAFPDINHSALIGLILGVIVTVIMAIVFFIFGKDDPIIESVEFHAPAGINSAEVGVIIDGEANDSDVISLILDWGRRGIITITEEEDDLILTRVNELEAHSKKYEQTLFNRIFRDSDEVSVESLKTKLYKTISKTEEQLDSWFTGKRSLTTGISLSMQIVGVLVCWMPITLLSCIVTYNRYFSGWSVFVCVLFQVPTLIIAQLMLIRLDRKKYNYKWPAKLLMGAGIVLLFMIASLSGILLIVDAGAEMIYMIAAITFNIVLMVEVTFMKKRTAYATQLLGQVLGLRNFIIYAEEDRLRTLVEENPYYFYDILPFAYALGLTDVWNKHFKNLTMEPCQWYRSTVYTDHYHMMHSMESHMIIIEHAFTYNPESGSGGFDFSSSSGGGGSFSGGGFGGSSGGGW